MDKRVERLVCANFPNGDGQCAFFLDISIRNYCFYLCLKSGKHSNLMHISLAIKVLIKFCLIWRVTKEGFKIAVNFLFLIILKFLRSNAVENY